MKLIKGNDEIFQSPKFKVDAVRYNLMSLIRNSENPEIYSDGEDIILARAIKNAPLWLWTSENISEKKINEAIDFLTELVSHSGSLEINCKNEVYKVIEEKFSNVLNISEYVKLSAYECLEPVLSIEKIGNMERPRNNDREIIADFLVYGTRELYNISSTREERLPEADFLIDYKDFYIWKDCSGKIVSMACIPQEDEEYARINRVFTEKDSRSRGYAKMLVYELSKIVLDRNKIPMLYTDKEYEASNKAYKNIGFKECGDLSSMKLTYKSKK